MFRRLGADDRTDEGDPVIASARADVEAIIARQGFIVADQPALKSLYFMRMRRALPISTLIDDLHGRHHLLARDLPALLVRSEEHQSELPPLMRTSYAVFL